MRINRVTFTGADDRTDPKKLQELQNKYPFVEWGILIASNPGRNRYPSDNYIKSLKDKNLNLALHICGKHSRDIMTDGILDIKYDFFQRYQINFNFQRTEHSLENYSKLVTKFPDKKFILQANHSNEEYIKQIINESDMSNTNILYDSSGGRGTEIKTIKSPYENIYTGYSGGLNPDNVREICEKLIDKSDNDETWIDMQSGIRTEVWIDMESGVRTEDIFDLEKVEKVLKIVDKLNKIGFTI